MEAKLKQNSICIELESNQKIRYIDQLNLNYIKTLTLEIINKPIGNWNRQNYNFNAKQNEIELNEKQIGIKLELNE